MQKIFDRTAMLIGHEKLHILNNSHIAVFGLGGVGSYAVEGLIRMGIENISIFDDDIVDITNINRQLIATNKTIGKPKTTVTKERIKDINENVNVYEHFINLNSTTCEYLDFKKFDYIVDAIDTITSKIILAEKSKQFNTKIISCMGTGNKFNPTMLEVDDIYNTSVCPLAKIMRKELRKRNIDSLKVVYSKEEPLIKRRPPGSVSFVPSVAGLIIVSEIFKDLLEMQ